METSISSFVKERRKMFNLTQVDLAEKSGVGLRFVRELEQGKPTLRIDKINQILALFVCLYRGLLSKEGIFLQGQLA